MVVARVDAGAIEGAGGGVRAAGDRCVAETALVVAAFGQLAGAAFDEQVASAARGAGQQWGKAMAVCAGAVQGVGVGLTVAGTRYRSVEQAAASTFRGRG